MPQERKRNHGKKRVIAPDAVPDDSRVLNFSFKHFDTEDKQFGISQCSHDFLIALIGRMQFYGSMTVDQFIQPDHQDGRHIITWENTTRSETGFANVDPDELGVDVGWQFCLKDHSSSWRVYGFVANATFNIVWLDGLHSLDKKDKKPKGR